MMRAVSVSTSAMRTGSNWEPTCAVEALDDAARRDVGEPRESLSDLGTDLEGQLGRDDAQDEGGHVLDQQATAAVVHEATGDRDGPRRGLADGRARLECRGLRHLQLEEPQAKPADGEDDGDAEGHQAWRQAACIGDGAAVATGQRGPAHVITMPAAPARRSAGRRPARRSQQQSRWRRRAAPTSTRSAGDRPTKATSCVSPSRTSERTW